MSSQSAIFNPTLTTSAASGSGFSVPRLTTTGRLAIAFGTGDSGMMVYDTTLNNLFIWTGSAWESVPASGDAGINGAVQYNDNGVVSGAINFVYNKVNQKVGIGTITPNVELDVVGSATITGALTVDTTTLVVNPAGYPDRVGIGTASPSQPLHVRFDNAGPTTIALFENAIVDFSSSAAGQIVVGARGYNNTVLRQNPDIGTTPTIGGVLDTILANTYVAAGQGKVILATQSTARLTVHESSGDVSIANGNVVMATSGKGIDFSATAGTGTSELLADYEEGTWTPTDASGAGLVFTVSACRYTKVGRAVTVQGDITYPVTVNASNATWGGFPFNAADIITLSVIYTDASIATFTYLSGNTGNVFLLTPGVNVINSTVSGKRISFSGTYMV